MKACYGPPGPHETTLILQAQIEELSPQQVLVRDELVASGTLTGPMATLVVRGETTLEQALQFEADAVKVIRGAAREFHQ